MHDDHLFAGSIPALYDGLMVPLIFAPFAEDLACRAGADAQLLPFADASFDLVVCQFGVMFFPDRTGAFAEMWRVLQPGGRCLFNVWDRIETNEFADVVTQAMAGLFPHDPPRFLARTPHGHHDTAVFVRELAAAGFAARPAWPRPPRRRRRRCRRASAPARWTA